MNPKDLPQPGPEEPRTPRFPHAAQLVEDVRKLPWPDWTGEALRFEFKGIKTGGSELDEQGDPLYIVSSENQSNFRPDYWVIGRIMDQEDHEFMERYLSLDELATSDAQVAINLAAANFGEADSKSDNKSIQEFEARTLNYEQEQRQYFQAVEDGYVDVLSVLNWAKVLDESKRLGIPVEEHPEYEDYSLEGFIVSEIVDARGISEQLNDEVQNNLILDSLKKDPTGVKLLGLRENAIRSRLTEEGENPDQHPWLVGFQYGRARYEQLVTYLLNQEDMTG